MTMRYLLPVLLVVTIFLIFAPGFLFTEDIPRKSDAAVLFVGPGNEARLNEARQLVKGGYARYLLIPFSGEIFTTDSAGGFVRLTDNQPRRELFHKIRIAASYEKYYENTHIEALEAKRMMNERGLKSAMLVSSGFHMRRIRMIADRVFDDRKYVVTCYPAQWHKKYTAADWLDAERRKIIFSEYVKIVWFLAYGVFI